MQTLISISIIGGFILPALFFANFASIKLDRKLVLRVFLVYFVIYLSFGCLLHVFPQLVDPR